MARIFRALLIAAVNAIQEFFAFATKGCLQDTLIFDIIGNVTILGKKFTNFRSNNYIKVPLYSYENSLEFVIHYITQPDSVSNAALIMPNTTTGGLMLKQNGTTFYAWAGNSSHWNALNNFNTGVPIDVNQERWIKITVNGTSISFFYSTDGETWTAANTGTLSAKINFTNGIGLGAGVADSSNNYNWGNGTILLEDCYFQYDDTKLVPYLYPKQLNDTIKLNDGIASSNYDWSACQDNEYGQFTATGTIEQIKEVNGETVYVTAEPEQDNKEVQIKTGETYYAWTDGTNTYYTNTDTIRDSDVVTLKNANIIGTLNNNNGVYSGFSDSNYLTCTNFLNNTQNSFEVVSKIYLTGTSSGNCSIIDTSQENSTSAFRFEVNSSMKLQCRLSNTIGSYDYFATLASTTTLQLNTWYFVKVTYNSSTGYALYLTQDESNWHDPEATTSNTSMINHTQSTLFIGDNAAAGDSLPGYIDLTKTSITINGNITKNLGETTILYKTIIYDENFEPLNPQPTIDVTQFVQPVLTDSGTMGGDSFAVSAQYLSAYYPWYPFASNANTNQAYTWAKSGNSGDYIMYNPDPIKVISFDITNRNEGSPRSINGGTVYGSNDGVTYTELTTFTNSSLSQNATWTIEVNSTVKYKYYKISATSSDPSYIGIGKIKINASSEVLINGNLSTYSSSQNLVKSINCDIDIIDNTTINTVTVSTPTESYIDTPYYAYTNENDNTDTLYATDNPVHDGSLEWTQPTLSGNGTLGGDSFAVSLTNEYSSTYAAWKAFDNNASTCFWTSVLPADLIIYNPTPLKVIALHWEVFDYNRRPTDWEWYGSNDNETYTLITSGTNTSDDFTLNFTPSAAYNYHKFKVITAYNQLNAKQITLTANEQTTPSTLYNSNFQPLSPQPTFNVLQQGLVNVIEVGDLNNTDGVYSGFDTSSSVKEYIISTKKFNFLADTWEIMTKVKFTASKLTIFMGSGFVGSESNYSISLGADASNHINVYLSSISSSWDIALATASTATFDLNKWYWIKLYFTGTAYNVDVSETGEFNGEESNFINISSSTKVYNANNYIMWGCNPYGYSGTHNLAGEIDMKETYFTCDNDKTTFYNVKSSIAIGNDLYERNSDNDDIVREIIPATIETSANVTSTNNDNVITYGSYHLFNLTVPTSMTPIIESSGISYQPANIPLLLKSNTGVGLLIKDGNNTYYRNSWVMTRDYDLHYQQINFSYPTGATVTCKVNNVAQSDLTPYVYAGDIVTWTCDNAGTVTTGSYTVKYSTKDGNIQTITIS